MNDQADNPHQKFVDYYAAESLSPAAIERFSQVMQSLDNVLESRGLAGRKLDVADVGCGAGTQCMMWARQGHRVHGVDINEQLVEIGRKRAAEAGLAIGFNVGSATSLPWPDSSMDVCLVPELLEHVADWESVLNECTRVMRPHGMIYLSTTNALCPKQQEFDLPLYSWYPGWLKRRYERISVTTRPELVNHAKYPAVHWFTSYELRDAFNARGFDTLDRFDLLGLKGKQGLAGAAVRAILVLPPLRWLAHVATPYSLVVAVRRAG